MEGITKILINFLITHVIVFIVYLLVNKRKKDATKLKENDQIRLFMIKYDIDYRKINYDKLLLCFTLCNAFIISFGAMFIMYIKSFIFGVMVAFVITLSLIYAFYEILGKYFKKRERIPVIESVKDIDYSKTKKRKTKKKEVK